MTESELKEIEERERKATPGPWESVPDEFVAFLGQQFFKVVADDIRITSNRVVAEDSVFIAHAREDIPRLIAEVRRLQAELKTEINYAKHCQGELGDSIEYQIGLKEENAELQKELDELKLDASRKYQKLHSEWCGLAIQNYKLREALEFYANLTGEFHVEHSLLTEPHNKKHEVSTLDIGQRAREALGKT